MKTKCLVQVSAIILGECKYLVFDSCSCGVYIFLWEGTSKIKKISIGSAGLGSFCCSCWNCIFPQCFLFLIAKGEMINQNQLTMKKADHILWGVDNVKSHETRRSGTPLPTSDPLNASFLVGKFAFFLYLMSELNLLTNLWTTQFWNVRFAHPDQTDTKMSARDKLNGKSWRIMRVWYRRERARMLCQSAWACQWNSKPQTVADACAGRLETPKMWWKNRDLNSPLGKENACFSTFLSETIRGKCPI